MKATGKNLAQPQDSARGRRPMRRVLLMLRWSDYEIIRGVSTYAHEAGWIVNDHMTHDFDLDILKATKCDGIVAILPAHVPEHAARAICTPSIKAVCLNDEFPRLKLPRVVPDNHAIGRMGAEHLLSRGFRRLAFYQAYDAVVERERMAGFREAAEKAGAEFIHLCYTDAPRTLGDAEAFIGLAKALRNLRTPVGIMSQYDRSANQIVLACECAGLAVPEEVAVVGVDNDPISSELGLVPLTSIDPDRFAIGYRGAALLDRLMDGEPPPDKPIRIEPKGIVVRKSTDAIAVEDPALAKALRFIWERFTEPIDVDDVAVAAAVSRRKLYALFQDNLHRTVKEEIDRARVRQACFLLRDTDQKLFSVARASGFPSAFQLARVFRRLERCLPTEYRASHRNTPPARM